MKLTVKLKKQITTAASEAYPDEMCGVIVDGQFIRLENVADNPKDNFKIDPQALALIEDQGEIRAYVHSHPDGSAMASQLDRIQVELHNKPYVICAYPDVDFGIYKPCGYVVPLLGRQYHHGYQDCYSLVRDFYQREMGIDIPDFERSDLWWESKDNASLYIENYAQAGFSEVSSMKYGDVVLCKVGRTEHPNHAVIWLGDNGMLKSEKTNDVSGTALILHHPYGRLSVREIYGQSWSERTVKILRHKELS